MLEEKCLEAIVITSAKPIYHLLEGSSAKAAADLLDQPPSLQHTATAEALALMLRRQAEDNLVWDKAPEHLVRQFTQPHIHTEFLVHNGSSLNKISGLIIPLATILDKISVSVADVSADDEIALSTLHAFEVMDLSGLGYHGKGSDELGENLQDRDLAKKPAMHIRDVFSEIRHIRLDFDWSEMHPTATNKLPPLSVQLSMNRARHRWRSIYVRKPSSNMTVCLTKMVKTSASAPQVLDLFQHVHGNRGFGVPDLDDPTNEPAVAPITQYDNPAPDKYKKAPKFQSKAGQSVEPEPTPTSAKVAWTASQNKLVVARVVPWKREFANLQRVTGAEPAVTQTEGHSLASNVDMAAMAHHLDAFRARQFENSHPSCVFASLSAYARGIAQADKQTWSEAIAACNE
ncbi:hypothetical protein FPANT_8969 [Fusarium pseudoanthophilum]|uniref:Uncharacterized protein n=1 Tax=Fusarium pseudoanthophilum TaxID=48495 RepID=A0A8H5KZJ6_9HYPO|nr:hypothetical protein FPANT_8969 [Fusarium pseudoanthophilum]